MNFKFTTTLFLHLSTGEVIDEEDFAAYEVDVTVEGDAVPYTPAKTYGDPDDCYPAEGGCIDDLTVTRDDTGATVDVPESVEDDLAQRAVEEFDVEAEAAEAAYEDRMDDERIYAR